MGEGTSDDADEYDNCRALPVVDDIGESTITIDSRFFLASTTFGSWSWINSRISELFRSVPLDYRLANSLILELGSRRGAMLVYVAMLLAWSLSWVKRVVSR